MRPIAVLLLSLFTWAAHAADAVSPKADHFFNGREAQLLGHVREFLDRTVAP